MTNEEYVRKSREELRQKFGACGVKEDCINYIPGRGCSACSSHDTGRRRFLRCEMGVCYFYKTQERTSGK